jgi:site-specific recombinase XerD
MELTKENPFQKVPLIRLEQKIVRPFTPEEVAIMLAVYNGPSLLAARNRAIVLTLLDTGVRASELTGLDVEDLDPTHGRARVLQGKGRSSA